MTAPPLTSLRFTLPGQVVDRGQADVNGPGLLKYVLLIRGPEDPERAPRWSEQDPETRGEKPEKDARRRSREVKNIRELFVADLDKHPGSTFNAMCVRTLGCTADNAAENIVEAVWALVEDGTIVHTLEAPVRFILAKDTVEVLPLPPDHVPLPCGCDVPEVCTCASEVTP